MRALPTTPQPKLIRTYEENDGATIFLTYELGGIELKGITYGHSGLTAASARLQAQTRETFLGSITSTDVQFFEATEEREEPWVAVGVSSVLPGGESSTVDAFVSVQTARELHAKLSEALSAHDQPAPATEAEVASARYRS